MRYSSSYRLVVLCVAAAVLPLAACSDNTAPGTPDPTVRGVVTDADGGPVADAALVLDLEFATVVAVAADKPSTQIRFALAETSPYRLMITDACDDEVFVVEADSAGAAGDHTFIWDGRDMDGRTMVEGFYHVHLEVTDHEPQMMPIALARNLEGQAGEFASIDAATVRDTWRIAARTDAEGRFTIRRGCWEFGQELQARNELGEVTGTLTVLPRVRVWAYAADRTKGAASAWLDFDPRDGATAVVRFPAP